jgi:23S rRNA pseudouridine1911/1915/1917 synthase
VVADGRPSVTHYDTIEAFRAASLVTVGLETGRTHQIRVHLAAIGHPVCGDPQYGTPGRYGLTRQFLHAHRLSFRHPRSGERLEFTSPLPADLAAALEAARSA